MSQPPALPNQPGSQPAPNTGNQDPKTPKKGINKPLLIGCIAGAFAIGLLIVILCAAAIIAAISANDKPAARHSSSSTDNHSSYSRPCERCRGSGTLQGTCRRCSGYGTVVNLQTSTNVRCPTCQGTGRSAVPCNRCKGSGVQY